MSDLYKVASAVRERCGSVVFLHGLNGHQYDTGRRARNDETFWPLWLADDIKDLDIYSVGYESAVSRWHGTAMHLPARAKNILERLLAEPALAQGSLALVGHSLGGLVIKELLRAADGEARFRQEAAGLVNRVDKVAFLATPHAGAGLASASD